MDGHRYKFTGEIFNTQEWLDMFISYKKEGGWKDFLDWKQNYETVSQVYEPKHGYDWRTLQ